MNRHTSPPVKNCPFLRQNKTHKCVNCLWEWEIKAEKRASHNPFSVFYCIPNCTLSPIECPTVGTLYTTLDLGQGPFGMNTLFVFVGGFLPGIVYSSTFCSPLHVVYSIASIEQRSMCLLSASHRCVNGSICLLLKLSTYSTWPFTASRPKCQHIWAACCLAPEQTDSMSGTNRRSYKQ